MPDFHGIIRQRNREKSSIEDSTTTDTYAVVIQKVNEKGEALTGVEFEVPFPVQAEESGVYTVKADRPEPER